MNKLNFYADITKFDNEERLIFGYASTESLDAHGEIITKEAIAGALEEYMEYANLREMHQPSAVGVVKTAVIDEKGVYVSAKVVDDMAWTKVKEGVYKGLSLGGKKIEQIGNKITKMKWNELSLVDKPANPDSKIDIFKLADEKGNEMENEDKSIIKTETEQDVNKSMDTVSRLAYIVRELSWLASDTEWEKQCEGDASQIPAALREAVKNLSGILIAHTVEELVEQQEHLDDQVVPTESDKKMVMNDTMTTIENAQKTEDIAKAGKRNSKQDQSVINQIQLLLKQLGAEDMSEEDETIEEGCGMKKSDDSTDIQKMHDNVLEKMESMQNDLKKIAEEKDAAILRIKELEAMPIQSKGFTKSVSVEKFADGVEIKKEEPKTVNDIIKAIHSGRI